MKLFQLPQGAKIKAECFNDKNEKIGDVIIFHRIDGMFSYCTIEGTKEPVHLEASTQLQKIGDYYEIKDARKENK